MTSDSDNDMSALVAPSLFSKYVGIANSDCAMKPAETE
jgi:hypothetical protein